MKIIKLDQISNVVIDLITHAASNLSEDVVKSLTNSLDIEISESGKSVLNKIIKNAEIAKSEDRPLCQDTGLAVFFVEIGSDVVIEGGTITEGINAGTRKGYEKGYLRKSTCDPLTRKNMGDNTPAIIHYEFTAGDKLKISYAAKGGGSENMSRIKMMKPSDGIQGIIDFAVETMEIAGPNPCPPNIIGIGIGGNFERSAIIAKKALFRNIGTINPDKELAQIEQTIYNKINNIGTGPMGFGGVCTALAVHIIKEPCHIASMPVAINIECHSHRHGSVVL